MKTRNTLLLAASMGIVFLTTSSLLLRAEDPNPAWTVAQWSAWRDAQIKDYLTPTLPADQPEVLVRDTVIDKCGAVHTALAPILNSDSGYFNRDPARKAAMGNFIAFTKAQALMAPAETSKHKLGFTISDEDYWKAIEPEMKFPAFLRSNEFLHLMSSPATYEQAFNLLEQHVATLPPDQKWEFLPFEAQFIKSITDKKDGVPHDEPATDKNTNGRTYGRLIVYVPNEPMADGGKMDRWILYSLNLESIGTDAQPKTGLIRPVSMIAVRRPPDDQPATLKTFFMDFIRKNVPGTDQYKLEPTALLNDSKNCYDCHKSAVLAIRPNYGLEYINGVLTRKSAQDVTVTKVTDNLLSVIRTYKKIGFPDWSYLNAAAYGPSLGPEIDRTPDFVRQVTSGMNLTDASVNKVINAMDCARCHEPFAPLNYLQVVPNDRDIKTTFRLTQSMVQTNIEKGWMPPAKNPNDVLSDVERTALYRCLTTEYCDLKTGEGLFVDWLRGGAGSHEFEKLLRLGPTVRLALESKMMTTRMAVTKSRQAEAYNPVDQPTSEAALTEARKLATSQKFQESEKVLWELHNRIIRSGVRGTDRIKLLDATRSELQSLYEKWKDPASHTGASKLKELHSAGGHGN